MAALVDTVVDDVLWIRFPSEHSVVFGEIMVTFNGLVNLSFPFTCNVFIPTYGLGTMSILST